MKYKVLKYKEVTSTNTLAMQMIKEGKAGSGLVLSTDYQTSGKGSGNNIWVSKKGKNILFSMIISPENIEPSKQFLITQIISLAIVYSLKNIIDDLKIKWPNDIYAGDKKIGGILIQNTISLNTIAFSVIGVGINVNQRKFPREIPNPVSIINIINKTSDRDKLLHAILKNFDEIYRLSIDNQKEINAEYLKHLYRYNIFAGYKSGEKTFTAKITGITQYGQLVTEDIYGKERIFNFKEVTFIN
jgi:BirA family biotin operon repressor/biotin-[acetyl-CoA-carboxylase] ligase